METEKGAEIYHPNIIIIIFIRFQYAMCIHCFLYFILFLSYRFPEVDQDIWIILSKSTLSHCYHATFLKRHQMQGQTTPLPLLPQRDIIHHKNKISHRKRSLCDLAESTGFGVRPGWNPSSVSRAVFKLPIISLVNLSSLIFLKELNLTLQGYCEDYR